MEYATQPDEQHGNEQEQESRSRRDEYNEWPFGGDDDRPQPWQLDELGVDSRTVGPGERDDVSPVAPAHGRPMLSSGSDGEHVEELARALGELGYPNSITRGENPFYVLDATVVQALDKFRSDYGVLEDPGPFGAGEDGRRAAANHVGPYTWEGVLRVRDRERDES